MGKRSHTLLVGAALAAALAGCSSGEETSGGKAQSETVAASDHDAFFLWAGVEPGDALASAKTVYILSGEVRCDEPMRFESLRGVPQLGDQMQIWLVVRADCLNWEPKVQQRVLSELARWSRDNNVVGLQVDYDSPTGELGLYAAFLSKLRKELPSGYALSATGLMDWSSQGDPASLKQLGEAVDEIVVQTYRGRHTVPNYQAYADSLIALPLPYRVALVQNGEWNSPSGLETDPEFLGYVVFLLND